MAATRARRPARARNTTPDASTILDLFAGPGGWSHGLRLLGLADVGIELDESACATRRAAGHTTVRADVAALPVAHLAGNLKGLIASPPCQGMSAAGLRAGWADVEQIGSLLIDLARGRDTRAEHATKVADPRSLLIAEPLRYALAAMPEWVACEQVPAVLPLWKETARHLEEAGYSTWCGILNAADYGVAQTRKRAFLIASRTRRVHRPEPTHAQVPDAPDALFGTGRAPWVSMADALGWGMTGKPAPTVTAGGGKTGGPEPFPTSARQALRTARESGAWALRASTRTNAPVRPATGPAATLVFGHAVNNVSWVGQDGTSERISAADASTLQGFPADYPWQGTKTKTFEQIGNAVPPPLASAVLAQAAGIEAAA